jgi:hypothetical protein
VALQVLQLAVQWAGLGDDALDRARAVAQEPVDLREVNRMGA